MTNHMHDKHGASYRPLTLFELVSRRPTDRPTLPLIELLSKLKRVKDHDLQQGKSVSMFRSYSISNLFFFPTFSKGVL